MEAKVQANKAKALKLLASEQTAPLASLRKSLEMRRQATAEDDDDDDDDDDDGSFD